MNIYRTDGSINELFASYACKNVFDIAIDKHVLSHPNSEVFIKVKLPLTIHDVADILPRRLRTANHLMKEFNEIKYN